jgi:hypothetical protein
MGQFNLQFHPFFDVGIVIIGVIISLVAYLILHPFFVYLHNLTSKEQMKNVSIRTITICSIGAWIVLLMGYFGSSAKDANEALKAELGQGSTTETEQEEEYINEAEAKGKIFENVASMLPANPVTYKPQSYKTIYSIESQELDELDNGTLKTALYARTKTAYTFDVPFGATGATTRDKNVVFAQLQAPGGEYQHKSIWLILPVKDEEQAKRLRVAIKKHGLPQINQPVIVNTDRSGWGHVFTIMPDVGLITINNQPFYLAVSDQIGELEESFKRRIKDASTAEEINKIKVEMEAAKEKGLL